jgi:hypothetical protein
MKRLMMIFQALYLGARLRRSATWKDVGAFVAVCAPFLALLGRFAFEAGWLPVALTQEEIDAAALWIWQGSGLVLAYWFRATSIEVGWGSGEETDALREPEPDAALGPESTGVLHRVPWLHVQSPAEARAHPGDDPGLDSFNR